ncbi:MAG: Superfamily and helicase and helicase subunit [Neobacillus sp.]|nr:Superfamily and helicase and helicase subunit [Neobacillus sp.]
MNNYDVIEVVHTSKTGKTIVLKVKEKSGDNIYALKLIGQLNDSIQRLIFKREVEALRILNSCKDIVSIRDHLLNVDFNEKGEWGGILLDYVYGDNLQNLDTTDFSQLKKYEICLNILKAVRNAHNNNILHRDLKPSNIMYDEETDKLIVIDFGTSKIKTILEPESTTPIASTNYSSPEVVRGEETTEASDIYSLGLVLYFILLNEEPRGSIRVRDRISNSSLLQEIKDTILKMVEDDPLKRNTIGEVIDVFTNLIGTLTSSAMNFIIAIDSEKLEFLKKKSVIESKYTMSLFLNSYLKNQFIDGYAYYIENKNIYIFVGANVLLECYYEDDISCFIVQKAFPISIDKRVSNQKRGILVSGKISFLNLNDLNKSKLVLSRSNNINLKILLKNYHDQTFETRKRDELFDELFGGWQKGLEESINNEKLKVGRVVFSDYEINDRKLIVTVEEYFNNSIDELNNEVEYIIDYNEKNKRTRLDIGNYSDVSYQNGVTKLIIEIKKNVNRSKLKRIMESSSEIYENYKKQIGSYTKQLQAIRILRDEEYSSKNLKDILLNLDEPTLTPYMNDVILDSDSFNLRQQQAIQMALYSDIICLIQGPPGTGKTDVIKEIVRQLVACDNKMEESPRILIVSQSHTAVDNILEGLIETGGLKLDIVRIGKDEDVSNKIAATYTMPAIRNSMFEEIQQRSTDYINRKQSIYESITEKKELERWERIKHIHKDWLLRCNDLETLDYQIIKSTNIIAGTCIGFLSNDFVKETEFDYVIIDEAAKATTPELLVSINKAKKIILVGDQYQLPAFANKNISPLIAQLTKNPQYRLFDILYDNLPDNNKKMLTTQYRMRKNIGNLISHVFYNDAIDTGIDDSRRVHGIKVFEGKSIIWFDTSNVEDHDEGRTKGNSYFNDSESTVIKSILKYLRRMNDLSKLDIGIITGYRGQKELLKKTIFNNGFDKIAKNIEVNTLDAFQGRQNDVIIYSTVKTKDSIGFQKEKERVNVAFSRARNLLIICGDIDFFYHFDDPENKYIEIIDYIKNNADECEIATIKG